MKLFTIFGAPVALHWSFALFAITPFLMGASAFLFILVVAGSVLAHELGHAFCAWYLGKHVGSIKLGGFGGVATIFMGEKYVLREEVAISIAGPIVSALLAIVGMVLYQFYPYPIIKLFARMNIVLLALNILPLYPLDGGRIFRVGLVSWKGEKVADKVCPKVTLAIGIPAALICFLTGQMIMGLIFLLVTSYLYTTDELSVGRSLGRMGIGVLTILALTAQ